MKKKRRRKAVKIILGFLMVFLGLIWFYTNSLIGVGEPTLEYYSELKRELKSRGYKPRVFAISGRRWKVDNWVLTEFGGAAPKSKHLKGQAIDILVLDVNNDGISDSEDVWIVYNLLNQEIVANKGGVGTYMGESFFFDKQMVHFDCRGNGARWHR